jgi:2-iminobutanoate/2-iminopropanoate deaminase
MDVPVNASGHYLPWRKAGEFVFTSGLVPRNARRDVVGVTVAEQTSKVLDKLEDVLADAGARLSDLVQVNVYLSELADWDEFNTEYSRRVSGLPPARTTIGCDLRGVLIELDAIAYIGSTT